MVWSWRSESGRFTLRGVDRGLHRIRVPQIGYGAIEVGIEVGDDDSAPATLTLAIARRQLVLPEIVVTGDRATCRAGPAVAADSGGVMERVRINVDFSVLHLVEPRPGGLSGWRGGERTRDHPALYGVGRGPVRVPATASCSTCGRSGATDF
jgi:hypothetical protein